MRVSPTVTDFLLLAVLTAAIGVGWLLGKRSVSRTLNLWDFGASPPSQYYRGLNFLLDGSQDSAIDAFTKALEVNAETFDTHIALGNILRRRGEVERAIKVHQNLLARPSLPLAQLHLSHLELARDYISAGLLDRSERLLKDLVAESGDHQRVAQRHLLEIYEAQRDWNQAMLIATELLPRRGLLKAKSSEAEEVGQPVPTLLAHYCCEKAEEAVAQLDYQAGRNYLQQALKYDAASVRATVTLGDLEIKADNPERAIKVLKSLAQQEPGFVAESVPLLKQAFYALDRREEFLAYLEDCLRRAPNTPLILAIAFELRDAAGATAAKTFLRQHLQKKPSLRGLELLMQLHSQSEVGEDEALELATINKLVAGRSSYRCGHCGFRGQQLHWHCPGCKHWGSIRDLSATGEIEYV